MKSTVRFCAPACALLVFVPWPGQAQGPLETTLVLKRQPLAGPVEHLEPEVLDFRYRPERWQACLGLPDDPFKTIVGSNGGLYYKFGKGPPEYEQFQARLLADLEADGQKGALSQELYSARVPIVTTRQRHGGLEMQQVAWAGAPEGATVAEWAPRRRDFLWLMATNAGQTASAGKLQLEVAAGLAVRLDDTRTRLVEEGTPERVFCAFSRPCDPSAQAAGPGLALAGAAHGPRAANPLTLNWNCGALAAGQRFDVLVTVPQGEQASHNPGPYDAGAELERAVRFWESAPLPYDRIRVPDAAVQALLDSCIRNLYQARELKNGQGKFQVGPTCYRGSWAADGAFILEAVAYLGRPGEARVGLEQQIDKDDGPGGVEFSKKAGLRLWLLWRHAQLTGDRQWLLQMWPRVAREVQQIQQYRRMTRSDPNQPNCGLMPAGFGDGGLGGPFREYSNVYWTLAGLRAAIDAAHWLNKPAEAWQAEFDDYWAVFDKARRRDRQTDAAGNTYVPPVMKGEPPQLPQRGAWAFLHSVYPGRIFAPDDPLMCGTLAMLDSNQREGLLFGTGWIADGVWNYAGSFYAHGHLWLGHGRKAAATLYAFGNHACPLLCWREEQKPLGETPAYCGDMPHNWASAEFIRLIRHLMVLERGAELHLLEGLPSAWTKPGAETRLTDIPTSYGQMSLALRIAPDGRAATLDLDPPRREPMTKVVVHLEAFAREADELRLDGNPVAGSTVAIPTTKAVSVSWKLKE
ncbi:MAG: hypothetical protein ACLQM8_17975 [Limisphaerales bacterium]